MNRRNLIKSSLLTSTFLLGLPSLALTKKNKCSTGITPPQTEGPFYPPVEQILDQVDKDADLITVAGSNKIAEGQIVIVEGVLSDQFCRPVENALVEIWQACHSGRYNHPADPNTATLDPDFQYWGKAMTNQSGLYRFRTIIPGSYPADTDWIRPPHIHFKVSKLGYMELITQMYFNGEKLNDIDLILQKLKKSDQQKVIVNFNVVADVPHPVGTFNIQIEKV